MESHSEQAPMIAEVNCSQANDSHDSSLFEFVKYLFKTLAQVRLVKMNNGICSFKALGPISESTD